MKNFKLISDRKNKLIEAAQSKIRERAISKVKSKIALKGKESSDFTPEQLEHLVAEEANEEANRGFSGTIRTPFNRVKNTPSHTH